VARDIDETIIIEIAAENPPEKPSLSIHYCQITEESISE
jgi:hypothetical protein